MLTPDFYPLSAVINKAFAESKTLVEEVDLDETNDPMLMMAALAKAMLTDGRRSIRSSRRTFTRR